jgi:hypothetical protein
MELWYCSWLIIPIEPVQQGVIADVLNNQVFQPLLAVKIDRGFPIFDGIE